MSLPSILVIRHRYPRVVRGVLELTLILTLWVGYSLSRLLADTALTPALARAHDLLHLERLLGIHWELPLNRLFTSHQAIGLLGSYWYASLHYVVTGATLLWLYKLGTRSYLPARRALVAGTLIGLVAYLLMPTAPPRFITGYVDVLSLHASDGWWSTDASAPRGLGGLTNELAAFPSLHAGWALWVAISVQRNAAWRWVRALAWVYAAGTAVVIVGTGNHWVIDVVVGWLVVLGGFAIARRMPRPLVPAADPVGVVPLAGQPTATSG
ncbi:phosphatase PAP2 family protein [Nocardioides sp. KIGAM211]|uniref:Phosphatase PAP2 family protein n=1 Tax=Nocardioides luti TaxID=2761101 RepID=A0A7X0RFF2_9ACTN|nr:phosphatase PAP2 family protein [Nocardioides luti]